MSSTLVVEIRQPFILDDALQRLATFWPPQLGSIYPARAEYQSAGDRAESDACRAAQIKIGDRNLVLRLTTVGGLEIELFGRYCKGSNDPDCPESELLLYPRSPGPTALVYAAALAAMVAVMQGVGVEDDIGLKMAAPDVLELDESMMIDPQTILRNLLGLWHVFSR